MPDSPTTPKESVDHVEEAQKLLGYAAGTSPTEVRERESAETAAQVHSNLAIAQELRGIREALEAVSRSRGCSHERMAGDGSGKLRCISCGHTEPDPFFERPGS